MKGANTSNMAQYECVFCVICLRVFVGVGGDAGLAKRHILHTNVWGGAKEGQMREMRAFYPEVTCPRGLRGAKQGY
jgi:hypothetical protein